MQLKNEVGSAYERLTVISRGESINNHAYWRCQCQCGNIVNVRGSDLRNGKTKSCGCLKNEETSMRFKKHGLKNHRLYGVRIKIISRCQNINDKDYKNYGGRGIKIYDEWLNDFMSFYNWAIENGYKEGLTIERIDVNGNYEPSNCTFIENKNQSLNWRRSLKYTYNGETKDIRYFANKYNVNYYALRARLTNYHWDIKKAIETKTIKGRNQYGVKGLPN